jgi:WD40 repeat protein
MFVASGGRDGKVNIWNLVEGRHLDEVDAESPVNVLLFASKVYWLVIGTEDGIRVYDLPHRKFVNTYRAQDLDGANADGKENKARIGCTSLAWSKDQQNLYCGWTDGMIRVLSIVNPTNEAE